MTMLVSLKKLDDRLVPTDEDSVIFFNSLKKNQTVSFDYKDKKQRSYQYHRFYFAMLKAVLGNQTHFRTIDNLHEVVKYRAGLYETIVPLRGEPFIKTKSISFDKMDCDQFNEFMKHAKDVCVELVSEESLEQILRFI
jgi:hypothetical protein